MLRASAINNPKDELDHLHHVKQMQMEEWTAWLPISEWKLVFKDCQFIKCFGASAIDNLKDEFGYHLSGQAYASYDGNSLSINHHLVEIQSHQHELHQFKVYPMYLLIRVYEQEIIFSAL
ncbi:hypothetical protein Tco_1221226 [Tanacetum coccineum]